VPWHRLLQWQELLLWRVSGRLLACEDELLGCVGKKALWGFPVWMAVFLEVRAALE
jgi:hypothetical protein